VAVAGFALYIHFRGIPKYKPVVVDLKFEHTPERIQHGSKLVRTLCAECHGGDDGKLSGGKLDDIPKEFGTAYAPNITNHKEYGIGSWTDGQVAVLLRTGLRPDGQYVPLWMPKFNHMAEEDILSVIAFLRSDEDLVQPSEVVQPRSKPSFLSKFLCSTTFKPFKYPTEEIPIPDRKDKVAYGRYLAIGRWDCYNCHSADFKTNNPLEPEKSVGFMGGGNKFSTRDGGVIHSANLTFDETGIAKYTEEEFIRAVKTGVKRDGTPVQYPMFPFAVLEDEEASAIYAYLKTVPKVSNKN